MTRPLIRLGISQLEEMYAKSKSEPQVLRQLENELQHRQAPEAIALMSNVQSALRRFSHPPPLLPPIPIEETDPQPELWPQPIIKLDLSGNQSRFTPMSLDKLSSEKIADLESLLLLLVPLSDAIGNVTLRNLLAEQGWDDELYWAIRNRLIERGILETGRGKGGSIRRASAAASVSPSISPATVENPVSIFPASQSIFSQPTSPAASVQFDANGLPIYGAKPVKIKVKMEAIRASAVAAQPVAAATEAQPIPASSLLKQDVIPLEDAYKVLRVAPVSAWNVVELARRQLVQLSSPIKTAAMNEEKRSQLQEQARRANLACLSIWRSRVGSKS